MQSAQYMFVIYTPHVITPHLSMEFEADLPIPFFVPRSCSTNAGTRVPQAVQTFDRGELNGQTIYVSVHEP